MKLEQYLNEAFATETGLVRQLQAQLTMTPEGSYRAAVERHLGETRSHAERVHVRLSEIGHENPWVVGLEVAETVAAQWLALAKTPWDMVRGTGVEEKVLKNAKDSAAAEALEIATYTAIEHLARVGGDETTAALAADILADEERMLAQIREELPGLVEAVARAEADAEHGGVTVRARTVVRRRRGAPEAPATEAAPAAAPSQAAAGEPWPGYDGQNVKQIRSRLSDADAELARAVLEYERAHKNRLGVIAAVEEHYT